MTRRQKELLGWALVGIGSLLLAFGTSPLVASGLMIAGVVIGAVYYTRPW